MSDRARFVSCSLSTCRWPTPGFGQIIIVTKDVEARDRLRTQLKEYGATEFLGHRRSSGASAHGPARRTARAISCQRTRHAKVKELAQQLAAIVRPSAAEDVGFNWMEPSRVVKLEVLQDKARQLGVTSEAIAQTLNSVVGGTSITQVRDDIYLVNVIARATTRNAARSRHCKTCNSWPATGSPSRSPPSRTSTTNSSSPSSGGGTGSPPSPCGPASSATRSRHDRATARADAWTNFSARCRAGYRVDIGGPVEESAKSQGPIAAVVPLMLFVMATILMIQLQSFQRLFLVLAVAPLGLIGVVAAVASEQFADGLCRHPGSPRAGRHSDPQFGDFDRADRGAPARRHGALGRGLGGHRCIGRARSC